MNKAESGLQLLSRLKDRPSLYNFDERLFPNGGPFPREVIEITGETACGKTILITEIIAKAILPVENGGQNIGVVFLNTDHHFQIIKLVTIMQRIAFANNSVVTDTNKVIEAGLGNFHILECHNAVEQAITLKCLDEILAGDLNIAMLVLDSIAAYYWSEQSDKSERMDNYYKRTLKSLQSALWEYKTVLLYTRPAYFFTASAERLNNFWESPKLEHINYRITLATETEQRTADEAGPSTDPSKRNTFVAKVQTMKSQHDNRFVINEYGLDWCIQ